MPSGLAHAALRAEDQGLPDAGVAAGAQPMPDVLCPAEDVAARSHEKIGGFERQLTSRARLGTRDRVKTGVTGIEDGSHSRIGQAN